MEIRGLYALTPDTGDDAALYRKVAAAARGGARILQYRNKSAPAAVRRRQALHLADYCRRHGLLFIVNDDVALARACGAGVHLGAKDETVSSARRQLGAQAVIGVSCQNSLAAAEAAAAAGAGYIAMGAVYPTATKAHTVRCPLPALAAARRRLSAPLVAIGGITPANAAEVIRAGADAVAVISGLFNAPDIAARARDFCRLFAA